MIYFHNITWENYLEMKWLSFTFSCFLGNRSPIPDSPTLIQNYPRIKNVSIWDASHSTKIKCLDLVIYFFHHSCLVRQRKLFMFASHQNAWLRHVRLSMLTLHLVELCWSYFHVSSFFITTEWSQNSPKGLLFAILFLYSCLILRSPPIRSPSLRWHCYRQYVDLQKLLWRYILWRHRARWWPHPILLCILRFHFLSSFSQTHSHTHAHTQFFCLSYFSYLFNAAVPPTNTIS